MTLPDNFKTKYGPWALVTGASEGIGREFALELAKLGLNLVLVARRQALLEELASKLIQQHSIEVLILPCDLSENNQIQNLLKKTLGLEIGLFVASAGFGTSGSFVEADISQELIMIDVNCRAVIEMSHHFGKRFKEQGRGGIILMSSLLAFQGVPRASNYAATKAFIQTFAEGFRLEMKPLGVDVIASAPGPIISGFGAQANMKMSMGQKPSAVAKTTLMALGKQTTIRPGFLSKFLEMSLFFLPRAGRVRILAIVMKGMTNDQA